MVGDLYVEFWCYLFSIISSCRCRLTALLATYGVKLPSYLSHRINASVTFPELTTTQNVKIAVRSKFRVPGLGNHLVIEDDVTLKDLCALVEKINSFLKPLSPHHIDMMVFFSFHGHTLFETNLVHRMSTVRETTPETELPFLPPIFQMELTPPHAIMVFCS